MESFEVTIEARVRHAKILRLARDMGGINVLAKEIGVCDHTLRKWINFRCSPLKKHKDGRVIIRKRIFKACMKLCKMAGCHLADLFPDWLEALRALPVKMETTRTLTRQQIESIPKHQDLICTDSPLQQAIDDDEQEDVRNMITKILPEREAKIIRMRFGIGCDRLTLEKAGETLGISRERTSQLEHRAINRLRTAYLGKGRFPT